MSSPAGGGEDPLASRGCWAARTRWAGDVEAGLALAELIASISKPSAAVVLGGGHSIGIPLAVSARRSFFCAHGHRDHPPGAPFRHDLGVPQTMRWFEQMQERITGFVAAHSGWENLPRPPPRGRGWVVGGGGWPPGPCGKTPPPLGGFRLFGGVFSVKGYLPFPKITKNPDGGSFPPLFL